MNTYRELIFMIMDKLKIDVDDSTFKKEHVAYLLDLHRPMLLKQRYADIKKSISYINYNQLLLELEICDNIPTHFGYMTTDGIIYKSTKTIPNLISLNGETEEYMISNYGISTASDNTFKGNYSIITPQRFCYAGENKWHKIFVFATIGADHYLYLKVLDSSTVMPDNILLTGLLETPRKEYKRLISNPTNYLDMQFPLEAALIPNIIDMVYKVLADSNYRPSDDLNNAKDDLNDIGTKLSNQQQSQ